MRNYGTPDHVKPEDLPLMALVGPKGEIVHYRARANGGGQSPAKWDAENERVYIPKKFAAAGWVFYEDVCKGNYLPHDGGEQIAMPEKYDLWLAAVGEVLDGYEGAPTDDDFYHPEVYARRGKRRGQQMVKEGSVFDHSKTQALNEAVKAKRKAKKKSVNEQA